MAAPSFVQASAGQTDATGNWAFTSDISATAGNIIVAHILQDGTTTGAVTQSNGANSHIESLAGVANVYTVVAAEQPVGSPTSALQTILIGRATGGTVIVGGTNSTSEDIYARVYEFTNVSTGTTLATVIENSSAGNAVNGAGTGTTISDTGVTTLGPDRLALNLVAANDDIAIDDFLGQSGGTWIGPVGYAESSGTDGAIKLEHANMASAGTINGGSDTVVSAGWGVVGFALIGTTVTEVTYVPRHPAHDFGSVTNF